MIRQRDNGGHCGVDADQNEDSADESGCAAFDSVDINGSGLLRAQPSDEHGRR
jgi:hypothetical protein